MPLNLACKPAVLCTFLCLTVSLLSVVKAEDPYRFFDWNVTYGFIYPLGVRQQGILINGQFPGPDIHSVTNDNLIINVYNSLDEPFLLSWNGIQQRRNSYEDGVFGTTCPIPPGKNFTYILQVKDQIGSFYYFPSLGFHKAAGGFGGIRILSRPRIPVPFDDPAGDYTILIGDWYMSNHTKLKAILDSGRKLPFPDGILINGRGRGGYSLTVEQGKTYRLRISNVGLQNSLNFRIQNHKMKLVEVEGTHTLQTTYSSLDVHVGQSYSVLFTADQPGQDYYIVVTSRFTAPVVLNTTGILHYSNSAGPVSGPFPGGPTTQIDWSLNQARSIRTNLTASGPRPNPQGSYHYGMINTTRTIIVANSAGQVNGKQRYGVNSVSFIAPDTPMKLADYFKIQGVFKENSISDRPYGGGLYLDTSVLTLPYRAFVEIVFQNNEDIVQSWHLDGYSFFVVGMDGGQWTTASRNQYNLRDGVSRCTIQVYPKAWTAIYIPLDNVGMWNLRTEFWARQYLGQQFYLRVYTDSTSLRDEYPIPKNALLCGRASGRHTRPLHHHQFLKRSVSERSSKKKSMAGNSRFDHDLVLAHKFPERSIALGVGACGRNAIDSDELKYVYHENGQQFVQLINKVSLAGLHDKGKAAILELETKSYEKQSGELLISTIYLLGAGGFSNSSHPYSYSNYPEKQAAAPKIPKSQPFAALLNRLSGDYNPLHSDPMIAEVLGSRPILHGIVLPGILQLGQSSNASAEGCKHHQDHIRRVPFACLYPGETLITEMVIYQAKVKERNRAVLSEQGYLVIWSEQASVSHLHLGFSNRDITNGP
ncbi:hypothetical protein NC653_014949 [Populus alba x Populus x berolinensis]|uniref:Uncharacterized protein n=1 Tax=Populus alba x Populus x berolinensis TaxID=444605 RepID=A0AAD6W521_9ROSI|nr:hypothetical protein NC653_014949 [Populus alba x Populus x berolinensis]